MSDYTIAEKEAAEKFFADFASDFKKRSIRERSYKPLARYYDIAAQSVSLVISIEREEAYQSQLSLKAAASPHRQI